MPPCRTCSACEPLEVCGDKTIKDCKINLLAFSDKIFDAIDEGSWSTTVDGTYERVMDLICEYFGVQRNFE